MFLLMFQLYPSFHLYTVYPYIYIALAAVLVLHVYLALWLQETNKVNLLVYEYLLTYW